MPLFRRRKGEADDPDLAEPGQDELDGASDALPGPEEEDAAARPFAPRRPDGPWDAADAPDDGLERLDLGALQVVVPPGVELRLDLDPQGQVVAVTFVVGEDSLQVGVFAAPRTEGIWGEVREEIAEALQASGGTAAESEGPYGAELQALIPTDQPGVFAPARFFGVDGPRWFLRGLTTGPAAAQGRDLPALAAVLHAIVVVRGGDAMPPREGLPLRLPREVQLPEGLSPGEADPGAEPPQEATALADDDTDTDTADDDTVRPRPPLLPPERGPEITETR